MNIDETLALIRALCIVLRLSVIRTRLVELLHYAESQNMTLAQFLLYIFREEVDSRGKKRVVNGLKPAGLDKQVNLDSFELTEGCGLDRRRLGILRQLFWVKDEKRSNLILIGDNGTGKTMLAKGLLNDALRAALRPFFTTFADLVNTLKKMDTDPRCMKEYEYIVNKVDLLCIDRVRQCSISAEVAIAFDILIDKIYEKTSIIVTANRPVSEWHDIFYDAILTKSILERLVHRSETITLRNPSYRLTHHEGFFDRLENQGTQGEGAQSTVNK